MEVWFNLLRQAILRKEISFHGIEEIAWKFSTSQGDFKKCFVAELNKWAKNRTYEYQYPTFMLISAIAQLVRKEKLTTPAMSDFELLPSTPAYLHQLFQSQKPRTKFISGFNSGI